VWGLLRCGLPLGLWLLISVGFQEFGLVSRFRCFGFASRFRRFEVVFGVGILEYVWLTAFQIGVGLQISVGFTACRMHQFSECWISVRVAAFRIGEGLGWHRVTAFLVGVEFWCFRLASDDSVSNQCWGCDRLDWCLGYGIWVSVGSWGVR